MVLDNTELNNHSTCIKFYAEEKGIKHVVHFTHIDNVENIIKHGLMSRKNIEEKGIDSKCSDNDRFDKKLDTISLSISCCNLSMLKSKIKENGKNYCIIFLKPRVLWEKQCAFYPHNAASKEYINQDVNDFRGGGEIYTPF